MTVAGNYVFAVTMSDGSAGITKLVTVQVFSGNQPPIISTLQSRIPTIVTLPVDTTILQGASYDLEADALTYQWTIVSQPSGASAQLATPTAANRCTARKYDRCRKLCVLTMPYLSPTHTVSRNLTVPVYPLNTAPVISSVSANPRNVNLPVDSSLAFRRYQRPRRRHHYPLVDRRFITCRYQSCIFSPGRTRYRSARPHRSRNLCIHPYPY